MAERYNPAGDVAAIVDAVNQLQSDPSMHGGHQNPDGTYTVFESAITDKEPTDQPTGLYFGHRLWLGSDGAVLTEGAVRVLDHANRKRTEYDYVPRTWSRPDPGVPGRMVVDEGALARFPGEQLRRMSTNAREALAGAALSAR